MTAISINTNSPIVSAIATSGQTVFTTNFPIYSDDDVSVYQRSTGSTGNDSGDILQLHVDYAVTNVGNANGFTVTLATGATLNDIITIVRTKSLGRTAIYSLNSPFRSEDVDTDINEQLMIAQDINALISKRGVFYNYSSTINDTKDHYLPVLSANQYWQMNSLGTSFFAAELEEDATVNTLRSELISNLQAAPGSDIVGHFSANNGATTVNDELIYAIQQINAIIAAELVIPTGTIFPYVGTTAPTGYVLLNDGTIGNASSGATNRANSDTQNLFVLLWNSMADAQAPVSTGRGVSALVDFNANKTITLPLSLGRAIGVAGAGSGLTSRVNGVTVGEETHTLSIAELPAHTHPPFAQGTFAMYAPGNGDRKGSSDGIFDSPTTGSTGSGTAHNNMQPTVFFNAIIKL